jgi:two-component system NarL family response regulator
MKQTTANELVDTGVRDSSAHDQSKIRVLIADDHAVVRDGLVAMIGKWTDMAVVAEACDGREAVAEWKRHRPDVSLLDLRMPVLDGVGAIDQIRALDSAARVILLTTFDDEEDIYRGIRAGAKSYLLKDAPREDILTCIRSVHQGATVVPPTVAAKLALRVSGAELTDRELVVLRALAKGLNNKLIGRSLFITEATVKAHLKSIFTKLNVLSRTEAIAAAARRGMVQL